MKNPQRSLSEEEIRALMSQVLQGLSHVHKNGYFHRDLKPGIDILNLFSHIRFHVLKQCTNVELTLLNPYTFRKFTGYKYNNKDC